MPAYHGSKRVKFPPLVAEAVKEHEDDDEEEDDDVSSSSSGDEEDLSPWGRHCYNRLLKKQEAPQQVYNCIVLEDLTSKFNKPCVLDLKMGTRTYSDSAPERKVRRAMEKAARTTTSSLGLRMCGLKVYDHSTNTYTFVDKYEGRAVSPSNIAEYISQFFSACPPQHRRGLVRALQRRLHQLHTAVAATTRYRFYSSSLLLVYDACPSVGTAAPESLDYDALVDLRMIDFANTSCYVDGADTAPQGTDPEDVDQGYLFGLASLEKLLGQQLEATVKQPHHHHHHQQC